MTDVWRKPLTQLLAHLTGALDQVDRPKVQLPHGAYIGLSRRGDGRRVLRIARAQAPRDEAGRKRWRVELDTFRKHLGLADWKLNYEAPQAGVAAAFVEPAQQEMAL